MAYTNMDQLVLRLSNVFRRKPVRDDDLVDRLHHQTSLLLLLTFAAGTALLEYAGEPINCWTPKDFPQDHYTQHVNGYCWTHPLRYPGSSHEVGVSGEEAARLLSDRRLVNFGTAFYRWVTIIFVLQAVLFKIPNAVWNYLNRHSGASLTKLRELLTQAQVNRDERHAKMDEAAQYLHAWLAAYRAPAPRKMLGKDVGKMACLFQCCGRRSGKYLSVVYLTVKALYLLNVVGNFVVLSVFLDANFWRYGLTVLTEVMVNGDWHDPVNFPRLLLCDFRLHENEEETKSNPGSPASANGGGEQEVSDSAVYPVQCVLAINSVLEKLFVLQWFWLAALAVLTIATFVTWSANTVCACSPYLFARKYMKFVMYRGDDARPAQRFLRNYLREDGVFVLRMVEANSDPLVMKELVQHLWDNFRARDAAFGAEPTEETGDLGLDDIPGEGKGEKGGHGEKAGDGGMERDGDGILEKGEIV